MKKIATLIMGLAAVLALTACGGKGTKVSEEKFKEKAGQIEEHEYSSATVKYEYSEVIHAEDSKEEDKKDEGKGEIKFEKKDGKWTTDSKDGFAEEAKMYIEGNLKDMVTAGIDASITGEFVGVETNCTYYTDPFGIEYTMKGEVEIIVKMEIDEKGYMGFDKYGYLTKYESSGTDVSTLDQEILGVKISSKTTTTSKTTISISYK